MNEEINCPAILGGCLCGKCALYKCDCCIDEHDMKTCPVRRCRKFQPKEEDHED